MKLQFLQEDLLVHSKRTAVVESEVRREYEFEYTGRSYWLLRSGGAQAEWIVAVKRILQYNKFNSFNSIAFPLTPKFAFFAKCPLLVPKFPNPIRPGTPLARKITSDLDGRHHSRT